MTRGEGDIAVPLKIADELANNATFVVSLVVALQSQGNLKALLSSFRSSHKI